MCEAESLLDADYRPPVRRGDLRESCPGRTVIIIDGEFGQNLSVSPKEILRLIDLGGRVIGASSMGALRAAELYPYGMEGCGWIYEAYRSGSIERDDEVALLYSPFDSTPLTVPLVNVRYWLDELREVGAIGPKESRRALRSVQQLFFAERTPERVHNALESSLGANNLRELLEITSGRITDVKAADARLALLSAGCSTPDCHRKETSGVN